MRFGELIPLTGAFLNFALALFIFCQSPRATTARVYFALGVCFAVWNYGTYRMCRSEDYEHALYWARFLQFGAIFLPITLCHVSQRVTQVPLRSRFIIGLYAVHGILFASNFTSLVITSVHPIGNAWCPVAGTGYWIFIALFSLSGIAALLVLLLRYKLAPNIRARTIPLLIAHVAFAVFYCSDITSILGYNYYPFTGAKLYPLGGIAGILYGIIAGYSVLQFQLLEVRVNLSRNTAKAVRVLFIFLTGLFTLLLMSFANPTGFTPFCFFAGLLALMAGAICAAVLFPKLFGDSGKLIEHCIMGDCFEYQDRVRKFIENMHWHRDLPTLFEELHLLLTQTFRLRSYYLILRNADTQTFTLRQAFPPEPSRQLPLLTTQSAIFEFLAHGRNNYLNISRLQTRESTSALEEQARQQLAEFPAEFCFPLNAQGENIGLLLVGEKSPNQNYTTTDISILIELVNALSVAANQIRLNAQSHEAQELDLLGRMSRGMAHDLNNLLTPIWTLLQLSDESQPNACNESLHAVALRNAATMSAYIKASLFLTEHLHPNFQHRSLEAIIKGAMAVARNSRKKTVDLRLSTPNELLIEMDEILIQRMIANIVSNAIDASPPGEIIQIQAITFPHPYTAQRWVRVRISDRGEGMSKEDLHQVFTPYFTTKNRGDKDRGFGLGLAICRKIANLHGGTLSIASQPGKGTTLQIDLPMRQTAFSVGPATSQLAPGYDKCLYSANSPSR